MLFAVRRSLNTRNSAQRRTDSYAALGRDEALIRKSQQVTAPRKTATATEERKDHKSERSDENTNGGERSRGLEKYDLFIVRGRSPEGSGESAVQERKDRAFNSLVLSCKARARK